MFLSTPMMEWGTVLLLLGCCAYCTGHFNYRFEFENVAGGPGNARSPWRSDASMKSALHVFKGDIVALQLCIQEPASMTVENVVISNDGQNDKMFWTLNGEPFARYEVPGNKGDWGHLWNRFKETGQVGLKTKLGAGKHNLVISIEDTDCHGSEIDYMNVSLDNLIQDNDLFCGYDIIPAELPSICTPYAYRGNTAENVTESFESQTIHPIETSTEMNLDTIEAHWSNKTATKYQVTTAHVFESPTEGIYNKSHLTTEIFFIQESTSVKTGILSTRPTTTTTTLPNFIIFLGDRKKQRKPNVSNLRVSLTVANTTKRPSKDFKYDPNDPLSFLILPDTIRERDSLTSQSPSLITTERVHSLVEQQSFYSNCPDESNVKIRFNPTDLIGTELIARQLSRVRLKRVIGARQVKFSCNSYLWSMSNGFADQSSKDFEPETSGNAVFMNLNDNIVTKPFPKTVDTTFIKHVYLQYQIPEEFDISTGFLRVTIGLTNITSPIKVGIGNIAQRSLGHKDSVIVFKTFGPRRQMMVWDIRPQDVPSARENTLHVSLERNTGGKIVFDTIILEFKNNTDTRLHYLGSHRKYTIRGDKYTEINNGKGFKIFINGQQKDGTFSQFRLLRNPLRRQLTISAKGKMFINHNNGRRRRGRKNNAVTSTFLPARDEVSGFVFGLSNTRNVSEVRINPASSLVAIAYSDSNYVVMSYSYSKVRSKVTIVNTSFKSVTFFSTYMSEDLTAVNSIGADDNKPINVMGKTVSGLYGKRFVLAKTTTNPTFKANDEYEIVLP